MFEWSSAIYLAGAIRGHGAIAGSDFGLAAWRRQRLAVECGGRFANFIDGKDSIARGLSAKMVSSTRSNKRRDCTTLRVGSSEAKNGT